MRNILLTERQVSLLVNHINNYRLLKEQTQGLDELMNKIKETYKLSDEHLNVIRQFISNSGCKNIIIERIKMGAGLSLSDRVILSPDLFNLNLAKFLFILFHEIAHQYQFKKYGGEKMYELYTGEMDIKQGCKMMRDIELVADEFAARKMREFVKLGVIKEKDAKFGGFYKNTPESHFHMLVSQIRDMLKKSKVSEPDKISELFYNFVKINI
jgi:hypothetical protein